jgi:hypothetical protein
MKLSDKEKETLAGLFVDGSKIVFAGAVASEVFKTTDGGINILLASCVAIILFLVGFLFVHNISKGGK